MKVFITIIRKRYFEVTDRITLSGFTMLFVIFICLMIFGYWFEVAVKLPMFHHCNCHFKGGRWQYQKGQFSYRCVASSS